MGSRNKGKREKDLKAKLFIRLTIFSMFKYEHSLTGYEGLKILFMAKNNLQSGG